MKKCSVCSEVKVITEFNKNSRKKDGFQSSCKTCNSLASSKYYKNNKDKHRAVSQQRSNSMRIQLRELALTHLKTHPCIDCGNKDFRVLDFDHVRGVKVANISALISGGYSLKKLSDEIDKCEVRCKNCHTIKTYERLGFMDWRSQAMLILDN